jgi:hypothetical protein
LALFVTSAAASTASRPASVTIANRPSVGQDGRISAPDLPDMLSEIFLQKGLDRQMSELPVTGKSLGPVRQIAPEQLVIPGRAEREPGIHNHHREYGFRACAKRRIHDAQLRNGE